MSRKIQEVDEKNMK